MCARTQPAVSGLETEFPGQVVASNVDATTPESIEVIQGLGFRNHGLVIRSGDGTVLWSQPDHDVNIEDARQALNELLQ